MAVDVGSAVGYLDLDISGFLAGLKSAQSEADSVSKNIATKIGSNIEGAGKKLSSVGSTLTKNVTVPLTAVGVAGLKVAMDFEKGMSEVKAISGATGKDFDALRNKAIDLGASTAFSSGEVAAAMTEMAKAGWSSQQIIDGMSGVLDAAAASGEGLATVSTIVADAITGFGMEAKDSTKVADLLTQAANSGTIGITDLGESFKYIAPVAGAMGMDISDVTTALSAMSMAGIKGSQAGTALRTMLTNLVNPSDDAAAVMEELGISAINADGSMKSLDDIVANLRTSFDGLTESEKAQYAAVLAGKTGMSGLLSLLNLTEEEYNAIAASMDNANDVAKETAAVMQDNLQSKVEQLGGSLESLAIKLADYVIPYLQDFVVWLTNLVDKFTNLDPETQKMILKFAAIAAAAGPVLLVLGKLVTGVGGFISTIGKIPGAVTKLKTGFTGLTTGLKNIGEGIKLTRAGFPAMGAEASKLGAAIGGITAPVAAVIAIIAVLVAAFVSLWKNNEEFRNKIKEIWGQIKKTFDELCKGIVDRLNSLGFDFENIGEVLKTIWKGFCDFLAPIFEGVFQNIANVFDTIVNVILGVLDFFISVFKGDWKGAWNAVKDIFTSIWLGIKNWFSNILNVMKDVLDVVCSWFGTTWEKTWNSIKTFFVNIWNNIVTWFKNTLNGIKTFFQNLWNGIKTFFTNLLNGIKTTFTNVWNGIKTFFTNLLNGIKTTVTNVWDAIKTTITNVINGIKTVITNVFNAIKTTITNVFNAIKTFATNVWNGIKSAITSPIETAKNTVSTIVNGIKTTVSNVFNGLKTTVSTVWNGIKSAITSPIQTAKTTVENTVKKIKDAFDFDWSLPKIKLPHFRVSGGKAPWGFGGFGSLPKVSVEWYKKAMNNGMILDSATIFGFDSATGKLLGGGEAGSETVVGTKNLLSMIRQTVVSAIKPIIAATYDIAKASAELGYITYNSFVKQAQAFERFAETKGSGSDGDTFIFQSPKPIDEIEAAKQMKKAKRELAEGF